LSNKIQTLQVKTTLLRNVHTGSESHPKYLSIGTQGVISPLGRKADHSPPPNVEVKNERFHTSISPICFHCSGQWKLYVYLHILRSKWI